MKDGPISELYTCKLTFISSIVKGRSDQIAEFSCNLLRSSETAEEMLLRGLRF